MGEWGRMDGGFLEARTWRRIDKTPWMTSWDFRELRHKIETSEWCIDCSSKPFNRLDGNVIPPYAPQISARCCASWQQLISFLNTRKLPVL